MSFCVFSLDHYVHMQMLVLYAAVGRPSFNAALFSADKWSDVFPGCVQYCQSSDSLKTLCFLVLRHCHQVLCIFWFGYLITTL